MPAEGRVIVLVQIEAKAGHEADVESEATALFERIRSEEEACVSIAGHRDPEKPGRFMFFEIWRDREEFLEFRDNRDYMQAYFTRMQEHVADGEFSLWEPIA
jgi:quinol monooxygenase YgiN